MAQPESIPVTTLAGDGQEVSTSAERHSCGDSYSTYIFVNHSTTERNDLRLYAKGPKPSGDSYGTTRVGVKVARTVQVSTTTVGLEKRAGLIANLELAVPVGATDLEVQAVLTELASVITNNDVMTDLHKTLKL